MAIKRTKDTFVKQGAKWEDVVYMDEQIKLSRSNASSSKPSSFGQKNARRSYFPILSIILVAFLLGFGFISWFLR